MWLIRGLTDHFSRSSIPSVAALAYLAYLLYDLSVTIMLSFFRSLSDLVVRSDARLPGMRTVEDSIIGLGNILSWGLVMKSFLRPFSPYR